MENLSQQADIEIKQGALMYLDNLSIQVPRRIIFNLPIQSVHIVDWFTAVLLWRCWNYLTYTHIFIISIELNIYFCFVTINWRALRAD